MGEGSSHSLTPKTLRISLRKLKLRMPHHGTQRCSNETSYGTLSSCSQQLPHRIDYIRQARLAVRRCQGTVGKRWYGGMRERMGFRPKRIGPTFWSGLIRSSSFTSASRNLHVSSKERGSYPSLGPRPCHRFLRPLPALWSYLHAAGIPCRLCPAAYKTRLQSSARFL